MGSIPTTRSTIYGFNMEKTMRVSEILFEGPYHHDSDVPSIKMDHLSISDKSLQRDYLHLAKLEGTEFDFWLLKTKKAALVTTPTKDTIGENRNLIIVDLHFDNRSMIPIDKELQVHTVLTSPSYRGRGLAMALYVVLCRYGYTIVSDFEQFNGGKALWKKMAAESDARKFKIRIWSDDTGDWVRDANNQPVFYDTINLSDDAIWHDFKSHMEPPTLLVLSSE
jgi:hypothetical protein